MIPLIMFNHDLKALCIKKKKKHVNWSGMYWYVFNWYTYVFKII